MATQKQIDANRKNALKSTGPKSPDGKDVAVRAGSVLFRFRSPSPRRQPIRWRGPEPPHAARS